MLFSIPERKDKVEINHSKNLKHKQKTKTTQNRQNEV